LQKLALRLRIAERDLLMWASEQQRIAAARPPGRRPPEASSPPDLPPLPLDEPPYDEYGDEFPDFDAPREKRRGSEAAINLKEAALEAYCLRVLFQQPKLIYEVNRKLRELARSDTALADGPLDDLSSEDFTRTSYRALMDQFLRAVAQDDLEPHDFLKETLPPDLLDEMEILLADEWEDLRPRLRHGLSADLIIVIKQNERFTGALDMTAELIEKALRLRVQRLQRERQEMVFLEMDGDAPYQRNIVLSILAKRLIDSELDKRSQLLRQ
jgi:hypothetical protein